MKAKELAEELLKHPDFDVRFIFGEPSTQDSPWPNIRSFTNIIIEDIGHSDKIIIIGGDEDL